MSDNDPIESPLVRGAAARLVDAIGSDYIIQKYRDAYRIDVSGYFERVDTVRIYECEETGYRFYYPLCMAGKGDLYRELEATRDGKYKDDKWEFRRALDHIHAPARLLDVGCGKGGFLKLAERSGLDAFGVELNHASAAEARREGLKISTETISQHSISSPATYDAVVCFQVLEHVPYVREFIQACIGALRTGGVLIFGVPNNDGFVGSAHAPLNMPPHHMGLWTRKSLTALERIFPLDLKAVELEPLAEIEWYAALKEQNLIRNRVALAIYYRSGIAACYRKWVKARRNRIPGHTIMAIYTKRN